MLMISTMFELICIPEQTEYCIYTRDYYIDREGTVYEKMPHGDVYEYGDLIIETPQLRHIFRRVYAAYDWCAGIIRRLREAEPGEKICICLDELEEARDFCAEGGYEVCRK